MIDHVFKQHLTCRNTDSKNKFIDIYCQPEIYKYVQYL